jgi:hypothetical protein
MVAAAFVLMSGCFHLWCSFIVVHLRIACLNLSQWLKLQIISFLHVPPGLYRWPWLVLMTIWKGSKAWLYSIQSCLYNFLIGNHFNVPQYIWFHFGRPHSPVHPGIMLWQLVSFQLTSNILFSSSHPGCYFIDSPVLIWKVSFRICVSYLDVSDDGQLNNETNFSFRTSLPILTVQTFPLRHLVPMLVVSIIHLHY